MAGVFDIDLDPTEDSVSDEELADGVCNREPAGFQIFRIAWTGLRIDPAHYELQNSAQKYHDCTMANY